MTTEIKFTEEEIDILMDIYKIPASFMKANLKAGGNWILVGYGLRIIYENGEYVGRKEN